MILSLDDVFVACVRQNSTTSTVSQKDGLPRYDAPVDAQEARRRADPTQDSRGGRAVLRRGCRKDADRHFRVAATGWPRETREGTEAKGRQVAGGAIPDQG